jgi:hypothetical protein
MATLYDRLGVTPDATADELRAAYRVRAQLVHPDRHAGADPAVRELAETEMAALNEAIAVLADPTQRQAYDGLVGIVPAPPPPAPPPGREWWADAAPGAAWHGALDGCERCGASPAEQCESRRHVGALVAQFHWERGERLCIACGTRQLLADTVVTAAVGWWGIISFFGTPVTLLQNVVAAYRFRRELEPGRPVALGFPASILVVAVFVTSLVFGIAGAFASSGCVAGSAVARTHRW